MASLGRSYMSFLLISFCMLMSACETSAPASSSIHVTQPPPTDQYEAVAPDIQPAPPYSVLPPYRLQVGDVLRVRLLLNPELEEDVIIRPDGMISTALVQNMQAYGLTPLELQNELIKYYGEQLSDPKLSVIVQSFAPTRVYVLGEVREPGEFISVDANPTVLQAIARAGGILDSANTDRILVLRRGLGKQEQVFEVDYDAAFKGTNLQQDMRLAAQDIVIIPRSDVANVYHYYRQYVQQFLPASLGFGYDLND